MTSHQNDNTHIEDDDEPLLLDQPIRPDLLTQAKKNASIGPIPAIETIKVLGLSWLTRAPLADLVVGIAHPYEDFKKAVNKNEAEVAIEELGRAIEAILTRPFVRKRYAELIKSLELMRNICLSKRQTDTWNSFLEEIEKICLRSKRTDTKLFWDHVDAAGKIISPIES